MARVYTSVGSMAPFYVFPCGHSFHAHCLIAHVTRCTSEAQVSSGICNILLLLVHASFELNAIAKFLLGIWKDNETASPKAPLYLIEYWEYV